MIVEYPKIVELSKEEIKSLDREALITYLTFKYNLNEVQDIIKSIIEKDKLNEKKINNISSYADFGFLRPQYNKLFEKELYDKMNSKDLYVNSTRFDLQCYITCNDYREIVTFNSFINVRNLV